MARDFGGFQTGRKRDKDGRPLKLMSPPPTQAYRDGWEKTFGKKPKKKEKANG